MLKHCADASPRAPWAYTRDGKTKFLTFVEARKIAVREMDQEEANEIAARFAMSPEALIEHHARRSAAAKNYVNTANHHRKP